LVGNQGSEDLFITCAGGHGSDMALYAIPAPATLQSYLAMIFLSADQWLFVC
jgi:thiamine pyrophosphokinase